MSSFVIADCPFIVAIIAASFKILASSAPVKPAVSSAILLKFTDGSNFFSFACIFSIDSLPFKSGNPIVICLSNLPGLSKALSSISGLFVAANTIIASSVSKPSISTNNWFNVWLFSLSAPFDDDLLEPIASISSMNTIHGAIFLAFSNSFLTLDAPNPANISINSDPLIEINGTFASPAIAFAIKVLPVPGFPQSNTPLGIFAPISWNFLGFLRKSTICIISCFSSSSPAISLNVILVFCVVASYTFPFSPKPCIWINKNINTIIIIVGNNASIFVAMLKNIFCSFWISSIVLPSFTWSWTNSIKASFSGTITSFSSSCSFIFTFTVVLLDFISIFSTWLSLIFVISSVYATVWSSFCLLCSIYFIIQNTIPTIANIIIKNVIIYFFLLPFLFSFEFIT